MGRLALARPFYLSLCLTVLLSAGAAADDTLVSISPDGWLASFNPRTGAITQFHGRLPPNFFLLGAAWHDIDRRIYMVVEPPSSGQYTPHPLFNVLYSLDPETLELTKIADMPDLPQPLSGLTIDPHSHALFSAMTSGGSPSLYSIDPHTAAARLVGNLPISSNNLVTGLSLDSDGRFLYGLYYLISTNSSAPETTNLFRLDLTNAQPPLLQSLDPAMGALAGLVPIPGTTSFYTSSGFRFPTPRTDPFPPTEGTFNILDTSSLTFTKLGSDYWGQSPVRPLLYRNFNLAPEKPPRTTTLNYSVRTSAIPTLATRWS